MGREQASREPRPRLGNLEPGATPTRAEWALPVGWPGGNQSVQREARPGVPSRSIVQRVARAKGNQAAQRLLAVSAPRGAEGPNLGERIRSAAGRGSTLDSGVRHELESGLGADLSGVRVHTDGEADRLARSVDAVAFTSGSDVFFRSGAYEPRTTAGRRLLAHEATHVVQQARGAVSGTPTPDGVAISDPGDAFERAADATAKKITGP